MEFYNQNKLPPKQPTPSGSPFRTKYKRKIDEKTGAETVVECGKTNVYEKIQAAKDSTMIYNIVERYQNGEIGLLNARQGYYGDVSNTPTNIFEAEEQAQMANNNLNKLPSELRKILIDKGDISEEDIKSYIESLKPKANEEEITNG